MIDFLSGRFSAIERDLEARMRAAAADEEFEQATLERNRLQAVRSLLERRRVTSESVGTFDAVAVAVEGREANAQVFQVRDGVLSDRQSFYLSNETERELAEVAEEFMLQYYGGQMSIPALLVVQRELGDRDALADALASRRGGPVELRAAERGEKRRILELAERNARLALDQEQLRSERRRQGRVEALEGLQQALGLDVPPIRIECFDISNLGGTHTVASMVVFEGGAPKKSDYRRFTIRTVEGSDDFASMAEVLGRRFAQWERQADISPHDPDYDASFASLPNVVVIDGGKGQLAAGLGPLRASASAAWRWSRSPSGSRRCSSPAARRRSCSITRRPSCSCCSACATRRTASRSPTTARRRDRAMTSSLLDELPGRRARRASARCWRTSARPRRWWRPPARSCRRCRACRRRWRASSTATSTAPAECAAATRAGSRAECRDGRDQARLQRAGRGVRSSRAWRTWWSSRASPAPASRRR